MMPVSAPAAASVTNTENAIDFQVDYKRKYKNLKSKLKFLVYEQECFLEELRKAQRKLLKVSRDKSFLLDRLLPYEKINDSSGDSDATASSESDFESNREGSCTKKKKIANSVSSGTVPVETPPVTSSNLLRADTSNMFCNPYPSLLPQNTTLSQVVTPEIKKKQKTTPPPTSSTTPPITTTTTTKKAIMKTALTIKPEPEPERIAGQMTREELERHLESRQHSFGIEKAPAKLPMEIFSNENSDPDSESAQDISGLLADVDDDAELVIDAPQ